MTLFSPSIEHPYTCKMVRLKDELESSGIITVFDGRVNFDGKNEFYLEKGDSVRLECETEEGSVQVHCIVSKVFQAEVYVPMSSKADSKTRPSVLNFDAISLELVVTDQWVVLGTGDKRTTFTNPVRIFLQQGYLADTISGVAASKSELILESYFPVDPGKVAEIKICDSDWDFEVEIAECKQSDVDQGKYKVRALLPQDDRVFSAKWMSFLKAV